MKLMSLCQEQTGILFPEISGILPIDVTRGISFLSSEGTEYTGCIGYLKRKSVLVSVC